MTTLETVDEQTSPSDAVAPRPWSARLGSRTRDIAAMGILAAALLIPLRGLLRTPGAPMEEGFMLVFPERLLAGAVPNRDFLHLYGPGGLWVLAAVYKLFGTTLVTERLYGLLQHAAVVYGVFFLARPWGRRVAVVSGLLALVIILPPTGLVALAWTGGVGLGLLGLAVALRSRMTADERRARALAVVAGVLLGAALLYRIDLVLAVVLVVLAVTWRTPRQRVVALVGALAATASLYAVQFALAGFGNAVRGMVLDPIFHLRAGRHLPLPPSWSRYDGFLELAVETRLLRWPLPTLAGPHQLFLWFFALMASIVFVGWVAVRSIRRAPGSVAGRTLLAATGFAVGIVGQALQRPDSTHIAWVACVPMALLPAAILEAFRTRAPRTDGRRARIDRHRVLVACALPVLGFGLVLPNFTVRRYADFAAQTVGLHRLSFAIERDGRRFYHGNEAVAEAAQHAVDKVAEVTEPGDRLFVGTMDLRRTTFSEAWLYYMFPELTPGTYFIEMDPGVANAKGSRMSRDLRSSDAVILSNVWYDWHEPNDSLVPGPDTPNRVLRNHFCLVGAYGTLRDAYGTIGGLHGSIGVENDPIYRVYRRCR